MTVRIEGADLEDPVEPVIAVPFERLGTESSGGEGIGLGLAPSKRIIEAMEGTIGVASEVGRGTTFSIELPAA